MISRIRFPHIAILLSSFLLAAFSAQGQDGIKFQILQIQEEIEQNLETPGYDLESARERMAVLKASYKPAGQVSNKPADRSQPGTSSVQDYSTKKEAFIMENEAFIHQVKGERAAALKAGRSTEKYDKYIEEYEQRLKELEGR